MNVVTDEKRKLFYFNKKYNLSHVPHKCRDKKLVFVYYMQLVKVTFNTGIIHAVFIRNYLEKYSP